MNVATRFGDLNLRQEALYILTTINSCHPRRAASISAMSIFPIPIIASKARLAAARSESVIAAVRARGVICQDTPHLSLHHPHVLSWPPFPTITCHKRSVSAWSSVAIWKEKASLCLNAGPPFLQQMNG